MTRNAVIFVAASIAVLFLWFRLVDRFAPLPPAPAAASQARAQAQSAQTAAPTVPADADRSAVPAASFDGTYAKPSASREAKEQTVRVSTDFLDAVMTSRGARFVALRLKGVSSMASGTESADQNLVPTSDVNDPRYGAIALSGTDLDKMDWTLLTKSPESSPQGLLVRFGVHVPGTSLDMVKTYVFQPQTRAVGIQIDIRNSGPALQNFSSPLSLIWGPDLGGDGGGMGRNIRAGVVQLSDRVERDNASKDGQTLDFGAPRWVALKNHYFVVAFFPEQGSAWTRAELRDLGGEHMGAALQAEGLSVGPGRTLTLKARLWAGPQDYTLLKGVGDNFESVLQFQTLSVLSWLNPICVWLLYLLKWFYALTGNWGVAIILMTLVVRGAMFYPSMKSMVNMRHMQRKQAVLKPRLETLKKTYKDNPKKLNEETMKLYKEFGVNPLGGCLPMLIQVPVFFALYDTLAAAYELRGAGFCWKWTDMAAGDPTYIFPIAMGVSMFMQQRLSPTAAATASEEQQQMQKMMLWMMPIMLTGMALYMKWPVGLLLYWTASNVVGVFQQIVVNRVVKD